MKRTVLAQTIILFMVIFSTVIISQLVNSANANPNWKPWENAPSSPITTIESPVEDESYMSSDVWLKFNVTKQSDWTVSNGQITLIAYSVDGVPNGIADENETIVEVHDPMDSLNPTISFSYKLAGLKDGKHTVMVYVKGDVKRTAVGMESQMISFKVYSFPTTLVAVTSVVSVAVIGTALLFFLKKRKH